MKQLKRSGIYKSANITFDPATIAAHSYGWWQFVRVISGKVVFNEYRYSVTTAKHQRKVLRLMGELGIKIDLFIQTRSSLHTIQRIAAVRAAHKAEMQRQAEVAEAKRVARNLKAKQRRQAVEALKTWSATPGNIPAVN